MSGKRRVYEVARDMGMDNKALVALLESLGVPEVKNHMSVLTPEAEERVKRHLGKGSAGDASSSGDAGVKRPAVVRRRKVGGEESHDGASEASAASEPEASRERPADPVRVVVRAPVSSTEGTRDEYAGRSPEADASMVQERQPTSEDGAKEHAAAPTERDEPLAKPAATEIDTPKEDRREPSYVATPVVEPAQPKPALDPAPGGPSISTITASVSREESASQPAASKGRDEVDAKAGLSFGDMMASAGDSPAVEPVREVTPPEPVRASAPEASPKAPAAPAASGSPSAAPPRPSSPPKTGIEVWEGRPGVTMHHHRPGPRRVQYDPKAPASAQGVRRGPGQGTGPGGFGGPMQSGPMGGGPGGPNARGGFRGKPRGIGSFGKARGAGGPVTKERAAHKKVVRIDENVGLQSLAASMGVKATDLLRKLFQLGMTGININSTLDSDTAKIVASEFGWDVEDVSVSEEEQLQRAQGVSQEETDDGAQLRPPVVTIMGHVDHGKTSLLDALRRANVASGEAGGITQHIGAYWVDTPQGKVTFLDTPGHAAFTAMRARGAQATDIVVLVVAADDGVMPQTREAISHAKSANVPIVVAINKCDKPDAQPERVRRELADIGLVPEEWGGDTQFCEVSALTRKGLDEMVEKLAIQAEVMELRANPDKPASGIVIESQLDRGRGPVATVLVTEGTLRMGDVVLAGAGFGKVRAMQDFDGKNLKEVGPSGPVSIIGLSEVPRAGDQVHVVKDLKTAQGIAETRKVRERKSLAPSAGNKPRTLEEIARMMSEQDQLELKVIVKADVAGSSEAVADALVGLSTEKVKVSVVLQAAGAITENDVNLAVAAGAIIVGFNAKPAGKAQAVAQREEIEIRQYSIIYNLLDDVRLAMEGLLAPKLVEKEIGKAEVRQTFRISKAGLVAGSMVIEGIIRRGAGARLLRDGEQVWEGRVESLKRFKEDVREVKDGFECGISLENMDEVHVGDIIVAFEVEQIKQSL